MNTKTRESSIINWPVFIISSVLILTLAIVAILWPETTENLLNTIVATVATKLGWFYIATATLVVLFVIWIASSQVGQVRLGPDHSRPQFSTFSWASMLFAAGIGVDLLFFSVAEPISQFYQPPTGAGGDIAAAKNAVVLTLFHYGVTGWAMYALMGIAYGYFAYRFNMPLSIRSALYPIIGKRVYGPAGDAVDIAAMLGTVFGVATSLGIGVTQLNYGLHLLTGIPQNLAVQIALAAIAVIIATISAVSGVDQGIKRLSELNVLMALGLMVYITLTGNTSFLLNALIMNVGDYISSFTGLTLETYAFDNPTDWMNSWTLFFWAWWIAWAPFVGLFLARISRGRTIRQFVAGTLTIPFVFILLWVSTFGNSALELVLQGNEKFGQLALQQPEAAFYLLLEQYPLANIVMILATVVGFLLYVTSADSAALVMSNFTARISDASQDGPKLSRVFWATSTGILTLAMLIVDGVPALQAATVVMGLPFSIVMYLIMFGLYRAFQLEKFRSSTKTPMSSNALEPEVAEENELKRSLSQQVSYMISYPDINEINEFMTETCVPALEAAAELIRKRELFDVTVNVGEIGETGLIQAGIIVDLSPTDNFTYQLYPVKCAKPSYALRLNPSEDIYFRMEIFTVTGSLGYDVAGFSQTQIQEDVAQRYQDHLEFLHKQSQMKPNWSLTDGTVPVDWEHDFADPLRQRRPLHERLLEVKVFKDINRIRHERF